LDAVRKWLGDGADRAGAALARLSPRERWLSALAIVVLLAFAASEALRWSGDQRDRVRLAQAEAALSQSRPAAAAGALDSFDQAQWDAVDRWSEHGRNVWLVRLHIEQRLRAAAEAAGMADARINLAEATEGEGDLKLLRAEVTGPYVGRPVTELLRRLSLDGRTYVLDGLQVSQGSAPSFKISLLFPVRIGSVEPRR
jgi:hypothetical protein